MKANEEKIELYCQNPQCKKPLISGVKYVAEINGTLVHSDVECVQSYVCHEYQRNNNVLFAEKKFIPYSQAEGLAKKGKIKFSKLEKEAGEKNE
jgi:hypothetical protein